MIYDFPFQNHKHKHKLIRLRQNEPGNKKRKKKKMENEVETHGGGSEAMGLSEAVRGASNDAWMREGSRGMASGKGTNEGMTSNGDAGIRVRVIE